MEYIIRGKTKEAEISDDVRAISPPVATMYLAPVTCLWSNILGRDASGDSSEYGIVNVMIQVTPKNSCNNGKLFLVLD